MGRVIAAFVCFFACLTGMYFVIRVQEFRNHGATILPGTMLWQIDHVGLALFVAGAVGTFACLVATFIDDWRRFHR